MKTNQWIRRYGLWIIFIQAILATLGSLYLGYFGDPVFNAIMGEWFVWGNGFTPCVLCWFARILMYPITLLSGIAIYKKDYKIVDYIIPMAVLGTFLEIYHYTLQKVDIDLGALCTRANPCSAMSVNYFGFITIPFMCFVAFVVILIVSILIRRTLKK